MNIRHLFRSFRLLSLIVPVLALTFTHAQITVDSDPNFSTTSIQAAVDHAVNNDVIRIPAGSGPYAEYLVLDKNLALIGVGGNFVLTPPADPSKHAVRITAGSQVRIEHMTVADFHGKSALKNKGQLSLHNVSLEDNYTVLGALNNRTNGEVQASNCWIQFNEPYQVSDNGGGILNKGLMELSYTFVLNNTGYYGGIYNTGELFLERGSVSSNFGKYGAFKNEGILVGFHGLVSANNGDDCNNFHDINRNSCNDDYLYYIQ